MHAGIRFSFEVVDGDRLGKLAIPFPQLAYWLNFLTSPHYGAQIVYTEQGKEDVTVYFEAYDEVYLYLSDRVNPSSNAFKLEKTPLALAG